VNEPSLLILAGGFGTRLRPIVPELPKILAPVAGKPFIFWLLMNLERQGVRKIVLALHHQAGLVEQEVAKMFLPIEINIIKEPVPLGTGGAIAYAVQQQVITDTFWVMNGDTWLGEWVEELQKGESPLVGIVKVDNASRYGVVEWSGEKIHRFNEKKRNQKSGWINAGVYQLNASDFTKWEGQPFSVERKLFPKLVLQNRLNACPLQTDFIDMGVPEDYHRICKYIEKNMKK